jgi:hypothetical protein
MTQQKCKIKFFLSIFGTATLPLSSARYSFLDLAEHVQLPQIGTGIRSIIKNDIFLA